MALVSQTRSAGLLTEVFSGTASWTSAQSARVLDSNFASMSLSTFTGTTTSNTLQWSNFGFSFDPFATLSGFVITTSIVYSLTSVIHSTTHQMLSHGDIIATNVPITSSQSSTGFRDDQVDGSPTTTYNVDIDPDYNGITDLMRDDFTFTMRGLIIAASGSVNYRHFGVDMTIYVNEPDGSISNTASNAARFGNSRVRTLDEDGVRYPTMYAASGFDTRSASDFVLSGQPFSVYENSNGNRAIAVYDASSGLEGALSLSNDSYVYEGTRYSFLENNQHRVYRAKLTPELELSNGDTFVWQGIPLALSSGGDMVCKKITGPVDEIRRFSLGGVPLSAVRIGTDWALAVSDV